MGRLVTNIPDLHKHANRKLPRIVFDYLDGGGYEEETLRRNRTDLECLALRPRVLNDVSNRSLAKTMLGEPVSMPLMLDPVGACGIFYPNGEMHAARAALDENIPFCLSTLSINTIEDVAEARHGVPYWFQLYLFKDRSVGESLIERAKKANCSALVMSMDCHVRSSRYREERDGLMAPMKLSFKTIVDALTSPRWLFPMSLSKRHSFGNLIGEVPKAESVFHAADWLENQWDDSLSPKDIQWVKDRWPGKFVLKGIMHPDDAKLAVDLGADAVHISNHGGRQIDGSVSTVAILPAIVEAVNGRAEVFIDSGIRSGIDMLKMLGRGANACAIGRAFCYGLAVAGQQGVRDAIGILRRELDETLALCGICDVRELPSDLVTEEMAEMISSSGFKWL